MKTGIDFATAALNEKWNRYTYDQLDCQGFVEAVLKDIGVRKSNGSVYDWRGSNSMWRNYYSWRGSVEECKKKYGKIPVGAFVYMWDPTGEEEKGYSDGLGNFKHVGIYCGNNVVRDSTRSTKTGRNGPGTRTLDGFTKVSLFSGLAYSLDENVTNSYNSIIEGIISQISEVRNILNVMEGKLYDIARGTKAD